MTQKQPIQPQIPPYLKAFVAKGFGIARVNVPYVGPCHMALHPYMTTALKVVAPWYVVETTPEPTQAPAPSQGHSH
ncbi:MAG: hypothetical protein WAZ18_01165 [Alphaproteobacteria bacterium]